MEKEQTPNQSMRVQQEVNFEEPGALDYFQNLNYEIRLRKKRRRYVLAIPELGIVEKSEDLIVAYEKIQTAKEAYFRSMIEDGFASSIIKPADFNTGVSQPRLAARESLKSFLTKAAIVTFIIALFLSYLTHQVDSTLNKAAYQVNDTLTRLKTIEKEFKGIADWPEERVEKYRLRAHNISKKIKPIAEEIKSVWESTDPIDTTKQ